MTHQSDYTLFQKVRGHLKTVHTHRALVRKHCFACGLYQQGLTHDLSKYSPGELIPSIRYYQGFRSPYSYEKELKGYSMGWLHHKGRNLHHWDYWYDLLGGKWVPIPMPDRYLAESVCDRIAACKVYNGNAYTDQDALNYFLKKNDRYIMHEETAAKMEKILRMVAEQGEDAAFAYVRHCITNHIPL
ncbi:MAG: catalase [Solobacterium sp.]|nr:catalase [Solobacterium sp.]